MKYKFKFKHKHSLFWKTRFVIGHGIDFVEEHEFENGKIKKTTRKPIDAMILYYEDGGVERIPDWSKYYMKLGSDWKLALKEKMEKEIGREVI